MRYGETWVEKTINTGSEYLPYKFTGKEQDEETGLYYYSARYLDPKYSRWISTDPALGEYIPQAPISDEARKHNQNLPGMGGIYNTINSNLYHYAGNNPVKYTDPDGREAGDLFDSQDLAAKDFALTYNDDSIKNNVELASYIRQKDGKFYYDMPMAGTEESAILIRNSADKDIVAQIHTHGAYFEPYKNTKGEIVKRALEFSIADLLGFKNSGLTSYVVVPTGALFVVDDYDQSEGFKIGEFQPIFPSDPKCPYRKNDLNAFDYPDNYYKK